MKILPVAYKYKLPVENNNNNSCLQLLFLTFKKCVFFLDFYISNCILQQ